MYAKPIPDEYRSKIFRLAADYMRDLDLRVWETMDDSAGSTVVGNTDLTSEIVRELFETMPDSIGFVHGYAPSFTFGSDPSGADRALLSFDYYLDPEPAVREVQADLEELAALNDQAKPYTLVVHVREWSDMTRVKTIVDGLSERFSIVPLDVLLNIAGQAKTFKPHFAPP